MMLLVLWLSLFAHADENVRPKGSFSKLGYNPVVFSQKPLELVNTVIGEKNSIPWPVPFLDERRTVANSMAQFQPFGDPYFHGGCDLRTAAGAPITAPVSGRLEAGHYGYERNEDGSLTKFWQQWPESGDETYFELAIVDSNGVRFEFHHVDRATLPQEIVNRLNGREPMAEAGEVLGRVLRWPGFNRYDHLHYNIILPDGTRLNPEHFSPIVPDSLAPEVLGVFGQFTNGALVEGLSFDVAPQEIVVHTQDKKNGSPYVQPPVKILFQGSGAQRGWDFSEKLLGPEGKFPHLWRFFRESLRTPSGRQLRTEGGYGTGASLIRVPVPANYQGEFQLVLEDPAGNRTVRAGRIGR